MVPHGNEKLLDHDQLNPLRSVSIICHQRTVTDMRLVPVLLSTIATSLLVNLTQGADDKPQFSLFNPTPKEQLREMVTDRPTMTQSPFTVDAGHYQIEVEAFSLGQDRSGGTTTKSLDTEINFKMGICVQSELQISLQPYRSVNTNGNGMNADKSGLGDLNMRYKYNLWGNNGEESAAAVMPFLTIPTHSDSLDANRELTGGLIIPFSTRVEKDWKVGIMLEIDLVRNVDDDGYVGQFIQSFAVGHQIVNDLHGFVEILNLASADDQAAGQAFFNVGGTYRFGPDINFDAAVHFGLTEASEDLRFAVGISVRR
jgi:Putative MetA-pathway of phenol degradation